MDFRNWTLVRKWHEYAGPRDERLELDELKTYRVIAVVLSAGILVAWCFEMMYAQIAFSHDLTTEPLPAFGTVDALGLLLFACCFGAVIRDTKRGVGVGSSRRAQSQTFPAGYFAILSALSGAVIALVVLLMRTGIEVGLVGVDGTYWPDNLLVSLFMGLLIGVAVFALFAAVHLDAKKRQRQMEEL